MLLEKDVDWNELFKWFHRHPEIAYQEMETTEKIKNIVREAGIEIVECDLITGLICKVSGELEGNCRMLRADIDALKVVEQTGVDYASERQGFMHACGHDFHIVLVLHTLLYLSEHKSELQGTVYVLFQPAEEAPGGAKYLLQNAKLPRFQEVYGIHTDPSLEAGIIGICSGPVLASVDHFRITIRGKQTHAAMPQLGTNPITAAAKLVTEVSAIADGRFDPFSPKVISITHVEGGNTWNIIPEKALVEGTMRCMNPKERKEIKESIFSTVNHIGQMTKTSTEIDWYDGPESIINDKDLCDRVENIAKKNGYSYEKISPSMISDDFSDYQREEYSEAGIYLKVGTGIGAALHNPLFQVDFNSFLPASRLLADIMLGLDK